MTFEIPGSLFRVMVLLATVCIFLSGALAQDPDPNSPSPILLGIDDSDRAAALPSTRLSRKAQISSIEPKAFEPGTKIDLFITNIDLMKDEDFTAFRVYARSTAGRLYRFPTVGLRQSDVNKQTYVLTVLLNDELGFWDPPAATGDLLIQVTWRGMGSNTMRLGYGKIGGTFRPEPLAYSRFAVRSESKESNSPEYVGYKWSGDRMRFLEQATFGPTGDLDARIRRIGLRTWLAEQFELPYPSAANPYPNQPLKPPTAPSDCDGDQTTVPDVPTTCFRDTYTMYQPQAWFFREALYGDAQLRHRVAWALSQIWVTSGVDIQQGRHMVEYYKVLARNAFGNYRTLMKEMTLNPTMGDYLDMAGSTRSNPNENYPREIMQLFTIGLFMLNPDGTLQLDGSGNPIPTYDQNTVNNMTKVFTGWSFCQVAASCPALSPGTVNYLDPMLLNSGVTTVGGNRHDLTAKTLLTYPGSTTTDVAACSNCTSLANIGTYANNSLDQALDNIYNHPNVGPFVSKILIQHLVTSDPTPAYVGRVAAVFDSNRSNPSQLKEVVKAILLDPEARGDVKTDPNYGKLREPVQLVTNVLRGFNARSADALSLSDGVFVGRGDFNGMAQLPFQSPTVFNYYPPDYVIPGGSLLGPEFAIMTTGTSVQRANFMNTMAFSRINVSNPNTPNGTSLDLSELTAASTADPTGNRLLDVLNWKLLHGTMSASMRSTILPVVTGVAASNPTSRSQQALYLVATSSQFQVQR